LNIRLKARNVIAWAGGSRPRQAPNNNFSPACKAAICGIDRVVKLFRPDRPPKKQPPVSWASSPGYHIAGLRPCSGQSHNFETSIERHGRNLPNPCRRHSSYSVPNSFSLVIGNPLFKMAPPIAHSHPPRLWSMPSDFLMIFVDGTDGRRLSQFPC
jgi:hypothetical protein